MCYNMYIYFVRFVNLKYSYSYHIRHDDSLLDFDIRLILGKNIRSFYITRCFQVFDPMLTIVEPLEAKLHDETCKVTGMAVK